MCLACFVNGDYLALRVVLVDCYFLLCWVFCFCYCVVLPCFYSNLGVLSGLDGLVVWIYVWLFVNYVAWMCVVLGFVEVGLLLPVIFFVLRFLQVCMLLGCWGCVGYVYGLLLWCLVLLLMILFDCDVCCVL